MHIDAYRSDICKTTFHTDSKERVRISSSTNIIKSGIKLYLEKLTEYIFNT